MMYSLMFSAVRLRNLWYILSSHIKTFVCHCDAADTVSEIVMYNETSSPIWALCTLDFCHKNSCFLTWILQSSATLITTSDTLLICMEKNMKMCVCGCGSLVRMAERACQSLGWSMKKWQTLVAFPLGSWMLCWAAVLLIVAVIYQITKIVNGS